MHFIHLALLQVSPGRHASFVITSAIAVGTLALLIVMQAIIFSLKRKKALLYEEAKLMLSRLAVQAETAKQIGDELHDNIGQLLTTTKMFIDIAGTKLASPPATLLLANASLDRAISELRCVSSMLDKESMAGFNLHEELLKEAGLINKTGKMTIEIICNDSSIPLGPEKQYGLSRVLKESIQNVQRHSEAAKITIRIFREQDLLKIEIKDDGKGFDTSETYVGIGIKHMRDRVRALNGTISFNSSHLGTCVNILLPLQPEKT